MKKFFISAIAVLGLAAAANAQEAKNFVVNGDFEAPGYEQKSPYGWEPWNEVNELSKLPGWTLRTGGCWNGCIGIVTGEENAGDGELRPETDMNILHFQGYKDNGWTKLAATQVVEGLTVGNEYTLSFLVAISWPEGSNWTPDQEFGFVLAEPEEKDELDGDGNPTGNKYIGAGKEIVNKNLGAESDFEVYTEFDTPYTYTFTAPADKVYLEIFLANYYGEGNAKNPENGLWMDIDMVSLTGDEVGGVNDVIVADTNAPVEYFNLQGVRVANPENGLFIRRQGKTTTKVVL